MRAEVVPADVGTDIDDSPNEASSTEVTMPGMAIFRLTCGNAMLAICQEKVVSVPQIQGGNPSICREWAAMGGQ